MLGEMKMPKGAIERERTESILAKIADLEARVAELEGKAGGKRGPGRPPKVAAE